MVNDFGRKLYALTDVSLELNGRKQKSVKEMVNIPLVHWMNALHFLRR
jgi:hypothetical protein